MSLREAKPGHWDYHLHFPNDKVVIYGTTWIVRSIGKNKLTLSPTEENRRFHEVNFLEQDNPNARQRSRDRKT